MEKIVRFLLVSCLAFSLSLSYFRHQELKKSRNAVQYLSKYKIAFLQVMKNLGIRGDQIEDIVNTIDKANETE
mgnify:FL=1